MNSSATSFVSLPLLTEPFVTTKTRPARTVGRLVIVNTTVHRNRTSQPVSSVVSVVRLDTWLAIAPIARLVSRGATTAAPKVARHHVSTAHRRTSSTLLWPKWVVAARRVEARSNTTAMEAAASQLVATAMAEESEQSSRGSAPEQVVQQAAQRLGLATIAVVARAALHHGQAVVAVAVARAMAKTTATATLRLGHRLHLVVVALVTAITTMATSRGRQAWLRLEGMGLLATVAPWLPQHLLPAWGLCSRATAEREAHRRLHRRLLARRRLRLRPATSRLRLRRATCHRLLPRSRRCREAEPSATVVLLS